MILVQNLFNNIAIVTQWTYEIKATFLTEVTSDFATSWN